MIECRDLWTMVYFRGALMHPLFRSLGNLGDEKVARVILCEAVGEALKETPASTFQS